MKLNVISFNIRCCDDKDNHTIPERAPRLHKVTSKYDADILCFQEYREAWEPLIKEYYKDYDIFCKYRNETIDVEAVPILWKKDKYTLIKTGYFWLSDTPETESRGWDELYNCYRICTYVVLQDKVSGKSFAVMNTHFGFGDDGQVKSARLIYEYSKRISNLKTFVTGDFNMTPQSKGYKEITKYFRDVNVLTANDISSTYHGYHPETIKDQHIDYCFIDENITPVNQTLITETVEGKFPSDHFGLFVEIDI